ncbi:MAG: septum formation protein Maf [Clostridia bacterium]|nr:septum formation protein Maf [Clostridia bacterium]
MNFILASKSPRRKEILETIGLTFEVVTADTDESSDERDPYQLVELLSERKGLAVRERLLADGRDLTDTVIISSDTVVAIDGEILGKPRDAEDARRMLRLYSGRTHEVVSGICLLGAEIHGVSHEVTEVEFDTLDEETIAQYVERTQPYDKAGAYAIQGLASAYIRGIKGDYFNVVGLPVHRMYRLYFEIFKENIF